MRVFRHIHLLAGQRIDAGVIHAGRKCRRCRIKILYLLGHIPQITDVLGKEHRVGNRTARVRRHKVGNGILLFADLLAYFFKAAHKLQIHIAGWLSHQPQDIVRHMLRRHAKLAADMVFCQFLEESLILVRKYVVEPYAGPHKHFFDSRHFSDFSKQTHIICMIRLEIWARLWEQALPVLTYTFFQLLFTRRVPKIRCRTADIVNVSFKIGILRHPLRFAKDRFMAPCLYDPSLMKGKRTKTAAAKASAVACDAEFDLAESGNSPIFIVHGMPPAGKRQIVDIVHLLP